MLLASAVASLPGPEELVRFGHALQRDGRPSEALDTYARATSLHPLFATGWLELALAQHASGNTADALRAFERSRGLDPALRGLQSAYGVSLQAVGRVGEAAAAYRMAIARSPSDAEAHFNLGTALEADGELEAALRSYRRALDLEPPDEARVHNNIGGVLSARGELDASLSAYREAVEAEPAFADGWYNLGNLLLGMTRNSEAEATLLRALRLQPLHSKAGRKLQQLAASAAELEAARVESEGKLAALDEAAGRCADDGACLRALVEEEDARRDRDGPLVV